MKTYKDKKSGLELNPTIYQIKNIPQIISKSPFQKKSKMRIGIGCSFEI